MSILIKGMKMPKEGGVIVIYKEGNSFYTTKEGEGRRYPLIHVSPHGRLIDADALEQEMINGIKAGNYEDGYDDYPNINNMDDCVECVRYADTIIEAEEGEEEC